MIQNHHSIKSSVFWAMMKPTLIFALPFCLLALNVIDDFHDWDCHEYIGMSGEEECESHNTEPIFYWVIPSVLASLFIPTIMDYGLIIQNKWYQPVRKQIIFLPTYQFILSCFLFWLVKIQSLAMPDLDGLMIFLLVWLILDLPLLLLGWLHYWQIRKL